MHGIDAFAIVRRHGGVTARRNRVEILLHIPRHFCICRRHSRIEVTRATNDAIEILVEQNIGAKEFSMGILLGWRGVREAHHLRPPALAKQLLQAAMQKTDTQLHALSYGDRPVNMESEA